MTEAIGPTSRWALVGTGAIAHRFAEALASLPSVRITSVVSRSHERGRAFAAQHGIAHVRESIQDAAPDADFVYLATPVHRHADGLREAVSAGLSTLVEKPFARSAAEATAMFEEAAEHGVFVMEAMWTRFLPVFTDIRRSIADDRIGPVRSVNAGFGIPLAGALPPGHRLLDPALGGGSLLEVGVYPVQLVQELFGTVDRIVGMHDANESSVDLEADAILSSGERVAHVQSSIARLRDSSATIVGDRGIIRVPPFFHAATHYEISTLSGAEDSPFEVERVSPPIHHHPLGYQALHAMERARQDEQQSDIMPWSATIQVLEIIDRIRAESGGLDAIDTTRLTRRGRTREVERRPARS